MSVGAAATRRRLYAKLVVTAGLLVLPAGFTAWAVTSARSNSAQADRAAELAGRFEVAYVETAALRDVERGFTGQTEAAALRRWRVAVLRLRRSLVRIEDLAAGSDLVVVDRTRRDLRRHERQTERAFDVSPTWRASSGALLATGADATIAVISRRLNQRTAHDRRQAADAISQRYTAQNLELFGLANLLALGILLVAVPAARARRASRAALEADVEQLQHAARTDSLTGLNNHRAFHEDLTRELTRLTRTGGYCGLLMLDVDGLKQVNDTFGHHAGNEWMGSVA